MILKKILRGCSHDVYVHSGVQLLVGLFAGIILSLWCFEPPFNTRRCCSAVWQCAKRKMTRPRNQNTIAKEAACGRHGRERVDGGRRQDEARDAERKSVWRLGAFLSALRCDAYGACINFSDSCLSCLYEFAQVPLFHPQLEKADQSNI